VYRPATWHDSGVVAVLSVGLCGVLAITAHTDPIAVAAGVAVAQLVLAGAVFQGPAVPAPRTAALVVAAGGLATTALMTWPDVLSGFDGSHAGNSVRLSGGSLMGLAPGAAVVVVGAVVREMFRRGRRMYLTASLAGTVTIGAWSVLLAAWVAAAKTDEGDQVVLVAAAAAAVASLTWSLPGPRGLIGPLGILVGAAAGIAARMVWGAPLETSVAVGLAAIAAMLAVSGRAIATTLAVDPARRLSVDAVLPLVLVGPIAFWTGQLLA
jgi:hypothetical protein